MFLFREERRQQEDKPLSAKAGRHFSFGKIRRFSNMENEEVVSKNFIEQIIEKDIEEGHCQEIHTRFPPEPNGY